MHTDATYTAPSCRFFSLDADRHFLASDGFGGNGNPGDIIDPGHEYDY